MKLSEFKKLIKTVDSLQFELPDGTLVPSHYHVTEVGSIHKKFIDCGGTMREENAVNFQLWFSDDYDHSLKPQKLLNIITLSEEKLGIGDGEIEVEYQSDTIGKYGLGFANNRFQLLSKQTDCLAKDNCGVPVTTEKPKMTLAQAIASSESCCTPGGGCC